MTTEEYIKTLNNKLMNDIIFTKNYFNEISQMGCCFIRNFHTGMDKHLFEGKLVAIGRDAIVLYPEASFEGPVILSSGAVDGFGKSLSNRYLAAFMKVGNLRILSFLQQKRTESIEVVTRWDLLDLD